MKTICLATSNTHKVQELRKMLGQAFEIKSLEDIGCSEEIEETEKTLEGNSRLKAYYVYSKYHVNCLADDSGLEVEALDGAPGVYSARYAGEQGNHEKNMDKLLGAMNGLENRKAQFRTVVTLIEEGNEKQFEGIVKGKISLLRKGEKGFGYDPIFIPDGFDRSFAEMSMEQKNPISHRGKAIQKLITYLKG